MSSLRSLFLLTVAGTTLCLPYRERPEAQQRNPVSAQPSRDPQEILANAIQLQQAGDLEGAIREYQVFLASSSADKSRLVAYSNLGAALAHVGRYEEAIEQYHQALRLTLDSSRETPETSQVRFNLALAYYKAGQIPGAAQEFARLLNSQPGNMNAILLLADCHLRMGKNKQVVELLSPLESAHEDDRALSYLLGTALIRDHQVDHGQRVIDRILRDGDSAEARLLMGTTKMAVRDIPAAIGDLRRATELNPKLPSAHAFYGKALLESGSPERAVDAFRKELEINPNDFDANLYLGVLARQDHSYDEALHFFHRALEVRPGDLAVRYQIGASYLNVGKIEDAQRELEQVIKEAPDFLEAHVSLATVYYRQKRKQDGDREGAIVRKLNAEIQARQPGVKDAPSTLYRGAAQPQPPQ